MEDTNNKQLYAEGGSGREGQDIEESERIATLLYSISQKLVCRSQSSSDDDEQAEMKVKTNKPVKNPTLTYDPECPEVKELKSIFMRKIEIMIDEKLAAIRDRIPPVHSRMPSIVDEVADQNIPGPSSIANAVPSTVDTNNDKRSTRKKEKKKRKSKSPSPKFLENVTAAGGDISEYTEYAELRISYMDDSCTVDELAAAIAEFGGCSVDQVCASELTFRDRDLGTSFVHCPVAAAKKIVGNERLRVGWVLVRVRLLFRCPEIVHEGGRCEYSKKKRLKRSSLLNSKNKIRHHEKAEPQDQTRESRPYDQPTDNIEHHEAEPQDQTREPSSHDQPDDKTEHLEKTESQDQTHEPRSYNQPDWWSQEIAEMRAICIAARRRYTRSRRRKINRNEEQENQFYKTYRELQVSLKNAIAEAKLRCKEEAPLDSGE